MKRYIKSNSASDYPVRRKIRGSSGNNYYIMMKNIDEPESFGCVVDVLNPYDDADYAWAKLEYGLIKYISGDGKVVARDVVRPYDPDFEGKEEYVDDIVDELIEELEELNKDIKPVKVYDSTQVKSKARKSIEVGTSSTSVHINPALEPIDGLIDDFDEIEGRRSPFDPDYLEPEEEDDGYVELDDQYGIAYVAVDDVLITVESEKSWYFDDLKSIPPWPSTDETDDYESENTEGYTVTLDTSEGVVTKVKELLTPEIPVIPGNYKISFEIDLYYDINNVSVKHPEYEDGEEIFYTSDAKIVYNRRESSILNFSIVNSVE